MLSVNHGYSPRYWPQPRLQGAYCRQCEATNPEDFYKGITYRCKGCCDRTYEEDQALARAGKSKHVGMTAEWNRPRSTLRWKLLRIKRIALAGGKCERCSIPQERLDVHHLTYERFGGELLSDLQALCRKCHAIADRERREETRRWIEAGHRWGEMFEYTREVKP